MIFFFIGVVLGVLFALIWENTKTPSLSVSDRGYAHMSKGELVRLCHLKDYEKEQLASMLSDVTEGRL